MHRFILLIFLSVVAGCVSQPTLDPPRTSMKLFFDNEAMRAEVLKYVTPGMPIANAKRFMEDSRFKCDEWLTDGIASLHCSTVYGSRGFFMADEIQVTIYYDFGKVTDVKVTCYTVGP